MCFLTNLGATSVLTFKGPLRSVKLGTTNACTHAWTYTGLFPSAYYGWNLGMLWILIKKPNGPGFGGEEQQQLEDALRNDERVQGWHRERLLRCLWNINTGDD